MEILSRTSDAEIIGGPPCPPGIHVGSGDLNSGLDCMTSALSTGSSVLLLEIAIFKTEVRVKNLELFFSA